MERRIVIAGTGSGVGKTTLAIGIMAAWRKRGLAVQGFKCGPDYIDPTYHTAVTGRPSRNLDSWMTGREGVLAAYARGSRGADISVIEGVMGMYDGKDPLTDDGSTADIGRILESPVVLVVNIASMARSAAAIVKGFQQFGQGDNIVGVLANRAGSSGHYELVKQAIEQECGIPVLGYLPRNEHIELPERHLGLVPSVEKGDLQPFFDRLAEEVEAHLDLERLFEAAAAKPVNGLAGLSTNVPEVNDAARVNLAVAKDAAFHFYYPDNLEMLEAAGAKLLFFSPLQGEEVPAEADGLYIGGGFPEEFAGRLGKDAKVKASFRKRIAEGMPTLAECGGFMYLTEQIVDTAGNAFDMVGLIPGKVIMQKQLTALGYREITGTAGNFLLPPEDKARGHEFHYSTYAAAEGMEPAPAFQCKGRLGTKPEGYAGGSLTAGYAHLHFASNAGLVHRWIRACAQYRQSKKVGQE
ncbi:cobyrinate a,c-diamide synthase [Paenibacillus sp. GCM10023248]|uniref:cobyrinate a,c-diamide synthase n=1 Tax=unclassified Paenibacillus TaxID=185978 RepID=UPI00237914A4|nr:cobyrinate a,c-diamide synthase [Paenibacillus sp. MAHUQ-63]MDD9267539.1 cobyrinate a,c-diamide synthase [Paenibacillus sp. MAHUQ-63]